MNSATATLIQRVATITGASAKKLKRAWNATPANKRELLRQRYVRVIRVAEGLGI